MADFIVFGYSEFFMLNRIQVWIGEMNDKRFVFRNRCFRFGDSDIVRIVDSFHLCHCFGNRFCEYVRIYWNSMVEFFNNILFDIGRNIGSIGMIKLIYNVGLIFESLNVLIMVIGLMLTQFYHTNCMMVFIFGILINIICLMCFIYIREWLND